MPTPQPIRQAVHLVAILNLAYFGVEFAVALHIGSVSLFADSIDFLEDASINFLILFALAWSATARARVGMALAAILLVPGLATLWTAWDKFMLPVPPSRAATRRRFRGAELERTEAVDEPRIYFCYDDIVPDPSSSQCTSCP